MTIYTPLEPPQAAHFYRPPTLTDAQDEKRKQLIAHFNNAEYKIGGEPSEKGRLTEEEKFWLSNECILRYLRASKWDAQAATKRIDNTLKWRRDFGLYDAVTADSVSMEGETGKEVTFGYDVQGRPALYMFPSRQNTEESLRQMEFTVFIMEKCCELMGPGVETLVLMIDYADKAKMPSFSVSRKVLNIIQDHYPERLGKCLVTNLPLVVTLFFKMISPFIDPVTREKLKFNPRIFEEGYMTEDNVMKEWHGDQDFVYEHDKYWPALNRMCDERKKEYMERWRQLGGEVAVSEWEYKNGPALSSSGAVE